MLWGWKYYSVGKGLAMCACVRTEFDPWNLHIKAGHGVVCFYSQCWGSKTNSCGSLAGQPRWTTSSMSLFQHSRWQCLEEWYLRLVSNFYMHVHTAAPARVPTQTCTYIYPHIQTPSRKRKVCKNDTLLYVRSPKLVLITSLKSCVLWPPSSHLPSHRTELW